MLTMIKKPVTLSFGLGDSITVNAIVGLPTFKLWQLILDIPNDRLISNTLGLFFDLEYSSAAKGLPPNCNFTKEDFVRPIRVNSVGRSLITQLATAPTYNIMPTEEATVGATYNIMPTDGATVVNAEE